MVCLVDLVKLKNPEPNHLNASKTLDCSMHGDVVPLDSRIPKFHNMLKSGKKQLVFLFGAVLHRFFWVIKYQKSPT